MKVAVLCDFDGTITTIDTAEFILANFAHGNWQRFNKQFSNGEITLEETLRRQFAQVGASKTQMLSKLENAVAFRPYFAELAKYCSKNSIPLIIVSAGLDFVIEHFLRLNGLRNLVEIYMPKASFSENGIGFDFPKLFDKTSLNFKEDLVRRCRGKHEKVVYIGDGNGDFAAAIGADYVFAVKGSTLARLCKTHGIRCRNVVSFREVVKAIRKIVKGEYSFA